MIDNPVLTVITRTLQKEIANHVTAAGDSLTLALPNHRQITITVQTIATTPRTPVSRTAAQPSVRHTYHYTHQADFTDPTQPPRRLRLTNLAECRAYLDDVCHTLLGASVRDNEITLPDGRIYLLRVE